MGLFRWLFSWLLWPRRSKEREFEEPRRRTNRRGTRKKHQPGVYRIEVDGEVGRFHGDGPPFSFWASSRVIFILAFLLWWIQPAGPMIAGYVGGRRAGSPMKSVVAALLPVFAIFVANAAYAHNVASRQLDFVSSLPMVVSDAAASILPFLVPYREFMVAYMTGFANALTTTFGMGTNGYLMVIIFAYIGGLIAEQTRRELVYRSGAGSSVGVNLVQPLLGARPYVDDEEEAYEEDEEIEAIHRSRRPARARARGHAAPVVQARRTKHHRGRADRFDAYRKVEGDVEDARSYARGGRSRRRAEEGEDEDEEEEFVATRTHRIPRGASEDGRESRRTSRAREEAVEEERENPAARPLRQRSQAEERAIQRFVERALKNYEHAKH